MSEEGRKATAVVEVVKDQLQGKYGDHLIVEPPLLGGQESVKEIRRVGG